MILFIALLVSIVYGWPLWAIIALGVSMFGACLVELDLCPPRPNYNTNRDTAGCVVTMLRRDGAGDPVTVTRPGLTRVALAAIVALFDADEWYVACVSTPRTILTDLKGRKTGSLAYARRPNGMRRGVRVTLSPETVLLGSIGKQEYAR